MAKKLIALLLPPLLLAWHWYEPAAHKNQKGIDAFQQGKFEEAIRQFLSAKGLKADAPELKNNTAATLYELKKYREAVDEFSRITKSPRADFQYNLGNAYYRLGDFPRALESYKQFLLKNPDDIDGKKNFELTLKKIQEQNQQNPQPQNDPQTGPEQQKQRYNAMMQFLNQNEKQQLEKKKRKTAAAKNEKDW